MASSSDPSARAHPFIASADKLVYLWGGEGDTEPETVFIYRYDTETWIRQLTKGVLPPAGLRNGGCTISGECFYLYGGYDGTSRYSNLFELNINNWTWRNISDAAAGGPGKKSGCRMISYQDKLLIVGGFYYEPFPKSSQGNGSTNKVHCYNLNTGKRQ